MFSFINVTQYKIVFLSHYLFTMSRQVASTAVAENVVQLNSQIPKSYTLNPVAIASFPRSGNSLLRTLVEHVRKMSCTKIELQWELVDYAFLFCFVCLFFLFYFYVRPVHFE